MPKNNPMDTVVNKFLARGLDSSKIPLPILYAVEEMLREQRTRELLTLGQLKNFLPTVIMNTPHSCHTEEHCCALHSAHKAAADKVEKIIGDEIDKLKAPRESPRVREEVK